MSQNTNGYHIHGGSREQQKTNGRCDHSDKVDKVISQSHQTVHFHDELVDCQRSPSRREMNTKFEQSLKGLYRRSCGLYSNKPVSQHYTIIRTVHGGVMVIALAIKRLEFNFRLFCFHVMTRGKLFTRGTGKRGVTLRGWRMVTDGLAESNSSLPPGLRLHHLTADSLETWVSSSPTFVQSVEVPIKTVKFSSFSLSTPERISISLIQY